MTMNVVSPALASVTMSVPRSANLKYSAIAPPRPEAGVALDVTWVPLLALDQRAGLLGELGPRHDRQAIAPIPIARFPPKKLPTAALPPDLLLVLVGFEAEQLHLDVFTRLEFELARGEG